MLLLHRLFIRAALVSLVAGVLLGAVLQVRKAMGLPLGDWAMVTLHTHLLTVGFLLNMVMGVAHWMFPRLPGATPRTSAADPLAWANLVALNLGLLLRVLTEPFSGRSAAADLGLAISAGLQAAGVLLFLAAIWRRVRFPAGVPEPRILARPEAGR